MKKLLFLPFLFISVAIVSQVDFGQIGQDIDGEAASDASGSSVSMNAAGNIVAIGAYLNNGNGVDSIAGHVRVYENISGNWTQLGTDIDGEAQDDYSGWSVSMNAAGDRVAIGAISNDGNGLDAGHVRIYDWNGTAWIQLGTDIDGEAASDQSGCSVSMNAAGDRVAIGAYGNNNYAGHVRIFNWDGTAWTQLGADIDGEAIWDYSGWSVSMNAAGDRVAIGAKENNGSFNFNSNVGHVRIYDWNGTAWTQLGTDIDGEAASNQSGWSVSMNAAGDRLAIGENYIFSNYVKIFNWDGTAWTQLGADIVGEATYDYSGYSVSMNTAGDRVAIGAISNDGNGFNAGHVRVFNWNGTAWIQLGTDIDGEAASDQSGWSVSMNAAGDRLAIGAPNNDGNGISAGHVRIYSECTNSYGTDIQTACDSLTWIDGITYSASNNSATHTLTNAAGCDSVVTLDLTINNSNTGTDVQIACDSLTWIDGVTYTSSNNTATHTLTNASGCDTIKELHLTINNSSSGNDVQTSCDSYTWIDGVTYTASNNTATFTTSNALGCDSIVTLNLIINPIVASISQNGNDIEASATNGAAPYSYDWSTGETTTSITPAANGPYWLVVSDIDNCFSDSATFDVTFVSGTGVKNWNNSILIFPNPTNENITISIENFTGNIQTEVYDLIGNRLQTTNETTISLQDYARGIYLLKVAYGDRVEEIKVIKD